MSTAHTNKLKTIKNIFLGIDGPSLPITIHPFIAQYMVIIHCQWLLMLRLHVK